MPLKMAWKLNSGKGMLSSVFLKYDLILYFCGAIKKGRIETVTFGTHPFLQLYALRTNKAFPFTEDKMELCVQNSAGKLKVCKPVLLQALNNCSSKNALDLNPWMLLKGSIGSSAIDTRINDTCP